MRNRMLIKVLFVTLAVLIVIGGVLIYFAFSKYQEIKTDPSKIFKIDPVVVNENNPEEPPEASPSVTPSSSLDANEPAGKVITVDGKKYREKTDMLNILFVGIDYMEERAERRLGERSDMVMICAIDMKNYDCSLISIPRDTYTEVCHVNEDTGKVISKEKTRINAAFAFGGGRNKQSFPNTIRAVEDFMNIEKDFNLDIRYYAGIDIDGISDVASALGGVTVKLEDNFPGIGKAGDTVTLKGTKAMDYVRERKNVGGDMSRARRQQVFMMGIAKKIKKMGAVSAATKLFDKLSSILSTNFNIDEAVALAQLLEQINIDNIKHITVDGKGSSSGAYYFHASESSIREIMLQTYYEPVS